MYHITLPYQADNSISKIKRTLKVLVILPGIAIKVFSLAFFIRRYIKRLESNLLLLEGFLNRIKAGKNQMTEEEKIKTYNQSTSILSKTSELYELLSKTSFFKNQKLNFLAESILSCSYEIEAEARNILYDKTPIIKEDKDLYKLASNISLHSALSLNG